MSAEAAGPSGMRLTDQQRLDWLQLIRSESIGPQTFRRLLNLHGGAGAALAALPALAARRNKPIRIAAREDCIREIEAIAQLGARLIALGEPDYPANLRAIDTAPPLIILRGDPGVPLRPMVSIIGSRNASAAGLAFTERLSRDLARAGFVTVSGLARGVDARAHRATLTSGTVAVLAGGLDRIYPAEHAGLADAIAEHGAVLSEMPLGWEPRGRDFPRRNRIVSGLSLGTVVIEAARNSGSLITARFALDQGRDVFAVPGSPLDPRAEGTNALLRGGAILCTSAEDVIEALTPMIGRTFEPPDLLKEHAETRTQPLWDEWDPDEGMSIPAVEMRFEFEEPPQAVPSRDREPVDAPSAIERIGALLGPVPVTVDDIVRAADLPVSQVHAALLDLELAGRIGRHADGQVSLIRLA